MPLGQRSGDKSDSRYCGVEAEFDDDMPHVPSHNLAGGFDFVLAPLLKSHKDLAHFETAYGVKLHRVARLAPSQPVFTFTHPEIADKATKGFAGYFDAILYKDVHLGIEPSTATPNMFCWFPVFFPLQRPLCVPSESPIEVHFWQCCGATKVWYEWCVTAPSPSPIHNSNGRSYWVGL